MCQLLPVHINNKEDFHFCNEVTDRFKVIIVKSGKGVLFINNKTFHITNNSLIMIDNTTTLRLESSDSLSAVSLFFSPELINSEFKIPDLFKLEKAEMNESTQNDYEYIKNYHPCQNKFVVNLTWQWFQKVLHYIGQIDRESSTNDTTFGLCTIRQLIMQIHFIIAQQYKQIQSLEDKSIQEDVKEMESIITYLRTNYNQDLSLENISIMFRTNRTTLNNRFKVHLKSTVFEYLLLLRIKNASILLQNTLLSVNDICTRVGFKDTSNFSRCFKKQTKRTPMQYRNEVKGFDVVASGIYY